MARRTLMVRRAAVAAAVMVGSLVASSALRAGPLAADEQAFFDKHIGDVVRTEPTRVDNPGFLKVFATPFYQVRVVIKADDGDMSNDLVVARVGDKLVPVSRPSTDGPVPAFPGLLNGDFRLKTDADAKALQDALDIAYPIIGDDNKKAEGFKHVGNTWLMYRGAFFDSKMGYVLDVDADGKVTAAKYVLKLQ